MHTHSSSGIHPTSRRNAYQGRPPATSPPTFGQSQPPNTPSNHPTAQPPPPPPPTAESDDDPFAYLPPNLSTARTSDASWSLPVTPATPYQGRFSTGRSFQPRLPEQREEEEPRSALSSNFQFAFRPPSAAASEPSTPFRRPELTTAESSTSNTGSTNPTAQWVPISASSSRPGEDAKRADLCIPSTSDFSSEKARSAVFSENENGLKREGDISLFDLAPAVPNLHSVHPAESFDDQGEEDSPFPEVRASVSNIDDPDMPCMTFRMWFVGILLCLMLSSANMFFYLRNPAPYWSGPVGAILAWFGGKLLEKTLPIRSWTVAGYEFSLNPGPFNIKEHTLIYMLGGLILESNMVPYAMGATIAWEKKYGQQLNQGFDVLFVLSTQLLGFGLVGVCQWLLVWPATAIWPTNLATCALLNAFHAGDDAYIDRKGPRQVTVFAVVCTAACVWAFFPGYIFTALSYFSIFCWIFPNNVVVNQLLGPVSGFGMNIITFDWTEITMSQYPMTDPFWAQLHALGCFVFVYLIVGSALYYNNVWKTAHLPVFGGMAYDRFAKSYNVSRVFDLQTLKFNETAYEEYSQVYLPVSFALTYLLAFAVPPALLVQVLLVYWPKIRDLVHRKPIQGEPDDIHAKLMRRYAPVPFWWYTIVFVVCLTLSIGSMKVQPELQLPLAGIIFAIFLSVVWIIPVSYISAICGTTPAINLIAQIIPGALWPNRPFVNMVFKVYTVQGLQVGPVFVRAAKLGHYMKIPPKYGFIAQVVGITISAFVQIIIKRSIFASVQDVCEPTQSARLLCSHTQVFYTASIIWGLIGPRRQFGKGGIYYGEIYALIAGAVLPALIWWWCRRRPGSPLRKFNLSVALTGCTGSPPATGINYTSSFCVGFVSQWYMRKKKPFWWARYNYVVSGALDSGTAIGIVLCFLMLQLPKNGGIKLDWWGNTVWKNTLDANGVAYLPTDPNIGF